MPLNRTKTTAAETPTDHAAWLLPALKRRSTTPIEDMEPEHTLAELEIDDLDVRSLTDSMREYIKKRNPTATLARKEVQKAGTVRGELQLVVKKIEGTDLHADAADEAIAEVQERIVNA